MSETERHALFISHATPEDNHFVRWLGAKLTAMGYEVWADVMRLSGGDDWSRKLEDALRKRAAKMLLVCTPTGLEKQGVRNEIQIASDLARKLDDKSFIIPLRLDVYEAPFLVAQTQYIDFKPSWARGLAELVTLLRERQFPRGNPDAMETWLDAQSAGSDKLIERSEPLVSNWLQVSRQPKSIHFCESPVGAQLEPFLIRQNHSFPAVPHRTGVVTFAVPDDEGWLGPSLHGKKALSMLTEDFLHAGWPTLGIVNRPGFRGGLLA